MIEYFGPLEEKGYELVWTCWCMAHSITCTHRKRHSLGRVWYIASREPSDGPLERNYLAFAHHKERHNINNTALSGLSGYIYPIGAADAASGVLGWDRSNPRGSKTSQRLKLLLCMSIWINRVGCQFCFNSGQLNCRGN